MKRNRKILILIVLLSLGVLYLLSMNKRTDMVADISAPVPVVTEKTGKRGEVMDEDKGTLPMTSGVYTDYSEKLLSNASEGKVVLFFKASWCPTCAALDNDIMKELSMLPEDISILKVDFDKETELKKMYGVKIQHTLVQVDDAGMELNKWTGTLTLDELLSKII